MSGYVSARDALLRDIESAEAALQGAVDQYAEVERKLHDAQRSAGIAYEARAARTAGSTGTGNQEDGGR